MVEFLGTGVLGALFGGIFRILPEVLKIFDKVNERKHELNMFKIQTDLERMRGQFKVEHRYVDHSIAQLDAISEAFKEQSATASKSYKWVAAASAMVRPGITAVLFLFYIVFKITLLIWAHACGVVWMLIIMNNWTAEAFVILNMVLTVWLVCMSLEKYSG